MSNLKSALVPNCVRKLNFVQVPRIFSSLLYLLIFILLLYLSIVFLFYFSKGWGLDSGSPLRGGSICITFIVFDGYLFIHVLHIDLLTSTLTWPPSFHTVWLCNVSIQVFHYCFLILVLYSKVIGDPGLVILRVPGNHDHQDHRAFRPIHSKTRWSWGSNPPDS